jgi:S-adenosylhomocysteine hydrolase
LDPGKVFLLGKCYSSSPEVFSDLYRSGFQVSFKSFAYNSHMRFDQLYKQTIDLFVREAISKMRFEEIDRLIVLDDGGYLIAAIEALADELPVPIVCIEQTSSGFRHLDQLALRMPVINVARSQAKLTLEAPFIVESALQRFQHCVSDEEWQDKKVLILGCGAIGTALREELRREKVAVACYDPALHNPETFVVRLQEADVIFGCSGTASLKYEDFSLLKQGATLASVSSSDREFEAYRFRQQFPVSSNCLHTYTDSKIRLLQSGFPINFWGSRNNMEMWKIQLTMSLLMSGVFQSLRVRPEQKGFIPVDQGIERQLVDAFMEQIRLRSRSPLSMVKTT